MYASPKFREIDVSTEIASCQPASCRYDGGVHYEPQNNGYFQVGDTCMETARIVA